jgi:hypothetical protein
MRRLIIGLVSVALLGVMAGSPVSALTVKSKPSKTSITKISSKANKVKNKVDVTVSFKRSSTHVKAPLLSSQVKMGATLCNVSGKSTNCTLRNLSSGKVFKVSVRSRNKNGYGPWSNAVSYSAKSGSTWSVKSPSTSTPLPSTNTTLPVVAAKGLFDLSDAVGLFVTSSNSVSAFGVRATSTDLVMKKITSTGLIQNVANDSSVTMRSFYIAPNDKIYALDVSWRDPSTRDWRSCFILELYRTSGEPTCILYNPEEATGIWWGRYSILNASSALQFDRNGAVYFMVSPKVPGKEINSYTTGTAMFVRRYLNGVSTDFGIGYIAEGQPDCVGNHPKYVRRDSISSFHVMDDGTLLVDQIREQRVWQCDPNSPWVGRPSTRTTDIYAPDGSMRSVVGCSYCQFDDGQRRGAIQFFLNKDSDTVLANYDLINVRTGQITGRFFGDESISPDFTTQSVGCPPSGTSFQYGRPDEFYHLMVCAHGAQDWETSFSLLGGPRFAQLRTGRYQPEPYRGEFSLLFQITPQPRRVSSQIVKFVDVLPIMDQIAMSGLTSNGTYATTLFSPSQLSEITLIGPERNIKIEKLSFNSRLNSVIATGIRQSDGEKVLVSVQLSGSREVQIQKIVGEILNLQAFAS